MNNALFFTLVAIFFHIWGGAMLGTALDELTARQFSGRLLWSLVGGAFIALAPLAITVPTWRILGQPAILAVEVAVLLLAIGIPMFVPRGLREALFGVRTYWTWFGIGLILAGAYILLQSWELACVIGVSALGAGIWALWRGVRMLHQFGR